MVTEYSPAEKLKEVVRRMKLVPLDDLKDEKIRGLFFLEVVDALGYEAHMPIRKSKPDEDFILMSKSGPAIAVEFRFNILPHQDLGTLAKKIMRLTAMSNAKIAAVTDGRFWLMLERNYDWNFFDLLSEDIDFNSFASYASKETKSSDFPDDLIS